MSTGGASVPNAVQGKRLPFWKSLSFGEAAFELVSPLLVLWAARWFVGLVRGFGHLLDDDNVGPTVVGTVFFTIVAIAGFVGMWMLSVSMRAVVIESACPCCGTRAQRNFEDPKDPNSFPPPCGTCGAYLRADGLEVTEERIDTLRTIGLAYEVAPERYLPVVKRTNRGHFKFDMPAMCAICGSVEAKHLRDIGEWGTVQTHLGVMGDVASVVGDEISSDVELYETGHIRHGAPQTTKSVSAQQDQALSHLKVPVCAKHTEEEDTFGNAIQYRDGMLVFASYRYYRAFCELNHIAGPKPPTEPR